MNHFAVSNNRLHHLDELVTYVRIKIIKKEEATIARWFGVSKRRVLFVEFSNSNRDICINPCILLENNFDATILQRL